MNQDVTEIMQRLQLALQLARVKVDEALGLLVDITHDPRWLAGPEPGAIAEQLIASSPVDPSTFAGWGAGWWDASPYGEAYGDLKHIHTGADLNLSGYADAGRLVYAAADGRVVYAGKVNGWQQQVMVIEHMDNGAPVWTRYAHITIDAAWQIGMSIQRGERIGLIADYGDSGPKQDHLHFDIARIDLGAQPDHWPGKDRVAVLTHYIDPLQWLKDHA